MTIIELEDYGSRLLRDLESESAKYASISPTNNLYHYTSFNNFSRIIKSRELCFTDYRHLNDPTEILLSKTALQEAIQDRPPFGDRFWEKFSDLFSVLITEESFNNVSHYSPHLEKFESRIYTFSFCAEKDYLPMWRYYAGDGKGISLGFRPEYFAFKQPTNINDRRPRAIYTAVCYEKERLLKIINGLLDLAEGKINNFINFTHTHGISEEDSRKAGNKFLYEVHTYLSSRLLPLMPGFKHHGYKDEKEHRLYYLECIATFKDKPNEPHYFPFDPIPQERRRKRQRKSPEGICLPYIGTEVSYVESDKFSLDDIAEIWVGPSVHFECAREQIVKLLTGQGYDINKINTDGGIKIKKSQMPYK